MARLKVGQSVRTSNGTEMRLLADGPGTEVVGMSGIGTDGTDPDVWGDLPEALERPFYGINLRKAMGSAATRWDAMITGAYPPSFYKYGQIEKHSFRELARDGLLERPNPNIFAVSWSAALASYMKGVDFDDIGKVVAVSAPPEGVSLPAFATQLAMATQAMKRMMGDGSLTRHEAQQLFGGDIADIEAVARKFDIFKHPNPEDIRDDMFQQQAIGMEAVSPASLYRSAWRSAGFQPRDVPGVRFVNGEQDRISPPTQRSHVIKRGGHLIHLTHAEEVAKYANEHYDGSPRGVDGHEDYSLVAA